MLKSRYWFAGTMLVLSAVFSAQAALAEEAPASAPESIVLHIDEGFLGHPVILDLFDGTVRISWAAGDVLAPGDLTVTRSSSTQVGIEWSSSYLVGPNGMLVGMRVPSSTSPFDAAVIESKAPFGNWHVRQTSVVDGFASARLGAEGDVRLSLSPLGLRIGNASWYRYKQCDCAASPDFPKGTSLRVSLVDHPEKTVIVKVNDFGPDRSLFPDRVVDLDSVAFKKLSPLSLGSVRVTVEPL